MEAKDSLQLEHHLVTGINYFKKKDFKKAESYLEDNGDFKVGEMPFIKSLKTEEDLIASVAVIANRSNAHSNFIAWPRHSGTPVNKEMEDLPNQYNPELVKRYHQERAQVLLEELLHKVKPDLDESGIAIYLFEKGLDLTNLFLIRYNRLDWLEKANPQKAAEVKAYKEKWNL